MSRATCRAQNAAGGRIAINNRSISPGTPVSARGWALVSSIAALLLALAAPAPARVPQGFVGMMADGPILDSRIDLGGQMDKMVSSGVESIRVVFSWSAAEPYATLADVPQGQLGQFTHIASGVPTDFSASDRIVALAAQRGLTVLPVPMYAPAWDLETNPPRWEANPVQWPIEPHDAAPYASYLAALVDRYGPKGSFWTENPQTRRTPIRQWQIWNEPNIGAVWASEPFADTYVSLLRAAHDAVKKADPGARIVLAGLANDSWNALDSIYQLSGAGSLFDAVAIHPYTAEAGGVITILGLVRKAMNRYGDRQKPIMITELGWPSSLGRVANTYGVATTRKGQARKLARVIPMIAAARERLGIAGFDVYTWLGAENSGSSAFDYSGLFAVSAADGSVQAKPAFAAFRKAALAAEGCRLKAAIASRCRRAGQAKAG